MKLSDLSAEQQARVREAKSAQELFELAKNEGIELSEEDLEQVSGGWGGGSVDDGGLRCRTCGSSNVTVTGASSGSYSGEEYLGMASGLSYGVAVAVGGAIEPGLGLIGDTVGLVPVMFVLAGTAAAGCCLALFLQGRLRNVHAYSHCNEQKGRQTIVA